MPERVPVNNLWVFSHLPEELKAVVSNFALGLGRDGVLVENIAHAQLELSFIVSALLALPEIGSVAATQVVPQLAYSIATYLVDKKYASAGMDRDELILRIANIIYRAVEIRSNGNLDNIEL